MPPLVLLSHTFIFTNFSYKILRFISVPDSWTVIALATEFVNHRTFRSDFLILFVCSHMRGCMECYGCRLGLDGRPHFLLRRPRYLHSLPGRLHRTLRTLHLLFQVIAGFPKYWFILAHRIEQSVWTLAQRSDKNQTDPNLPTRKRFKGTTWIIRHSHLTQPNPVPYV